MTAEQERIKEQIIAVRDTCRTNMFDLNAVQVIANELGLCELVCFIADDRKSYVNFVMTGKFL